MPVHLSKVEARLRFQESLELARSSSPLPQEWIDRTNKVGQAPSRTFTPMLGTALLARAIDDRIDPFALKVRDHDRAYSARALCKDVLVPCCVEAEVDIRNSGNEPLNNQPFFRHERVSPEMAVHPRTRVHLDFLCECLDQVDHLDQSDARVALAAFLRARLSSVPEAKEESGQMIMGIPDLAQTVVQFITASPEGGRRGQAFVAAALDLVFPDVRTTRINDPSRHWPGDVVIFRGDAAQAACEVKQRNATPSEILQFVALFPRFGLRRAMVAVLALGQQTLDVDTLRATAWQRHAVHLTIFEDAGKLVEAVLTWTSRPLDSALAEFPKRMAVRLAELEVSSAGLADWLRRFAADDVT